LLYKKKIYKLIKYNKFYENKKIFISKYKSTQEINEQSNYKKGKITEPGLLHP